jgi:hypothetical protein
VLGRRLPLIQHGTPLYDLKEMGGKSAAMVRRYAHLAPVGKRADCRENKKGVTITRNALLCYC